MKITPARKIKGGKSKGSGVFDERNMAPQNQRLPTPDTVCRRTRTREALSRCRRLSNAAGKPIERSIHERPNHLEFLWPNRRSDQLLSQHDRSRDAVHAAFSRLSRPFSLPAR